MPRSVDRLGPPLTGPAAAIARPRRRWASRGSSRAATRHAGPWRPVAGPEPMSGEHPCPPGRTSRPSPIRSAPTSSATHHPGRRATGRRGHLRPRRAPVVVHGFSAEGILYAQTLSRLVDLGCQGHRHRHRRPRRHPRPAHRRRQRWPAYADLLGRVLDHLGIKRRPSSPATPWARLVTELAAAQPSGRSPSCCSTPSSVTPGTDGQPVPVLPAPDGRPRGHAAGSTPSPRSRGSATRARRSGGLVGPTIGATWEVADARPPASILRSRGSRRHARGLGAAKVPGVRGPRRLGLRRAGPDRQGRR